MDKLPKEQMWSHFQSKEHYLAFRKAWAKRTTQTHKLMKVCRVRVGERIEIPGKPGMFSRGPYTKQKLELERRVKLDTKYHMLYAILRGRDWRKGYQFDKVPQIGTAHEAYQRVFRNKFTHEELEEVFGGEVTFSMVEKAVMNLPEWKWYAHNGVVEKPGAYKKPFPISIAPAAPAVAS